MPKRRTSKPQKKPIVSDPTVKLGRPVVAGTRITVDEILDQLAAGATVKQIAARAAGLSVPSVLEAVRFAAEAVRADSPLDEKSPHELHGARVVSLPKTATGENSTAIAVRAYLPEASAVAVQRLTTMPPGRAWLPGLAESGKAADSAEPAGRSVHPMERIHPAGVFEAVFPGETQPFVYRLAVTMADGSVKYLQPSHGLPPALSRADLAELSVRPGNAEALQSARLANRWHERLGAHLIEHCGLPGVAFAVWAPNAAQVSVVGDFNGWNTLADPMRPVGDSGVWELFVPGVAEGALYKYRITSRVDGRTFDKADPFAFAAELRPRTASRVWHLRGYDWHDEPWLADRQRRQSLESPLAIYEVHLGSWRRPAPSAAKGGERGWFNYRELADQLIPYVKEMGYTHIEPMPVSEHPFDGSWGYQITGFFAPTARFGAPDDFRYFVDRAHQAGLGVILDWVPAHFPKDAHGLAQFDGTPLFEHADPRRSENYEWGTSAFNLDRPEVAAFLLSNASYWIEHFHVDGLRVDAVSSMIYLDYSRRHWLPNERGGRENLEAAAFFQRLNRHVHREHPGVLMIAEESTAWPHVTGQREADSLGFDLKWNLGWMHDTLGYAEQDPIFRRHHHQKLTFSLVYAFHENFLLPFSHDEVVHGKRSLLGKMSGDAWQQFANLRAFYGYMYAHPGKKLHFMGSEFAPTAEWNHEGELDWALLADPRRAKLRAFVGALNRLYVAEPALHEVDFGWEGFQWLACDDAERSIVAWLRRSRAGKRQVVVVANFTPEARPGYVVGVPTPGEYFELLNSDAAEFGGGDVRNTGPLASRPLTIHGQSQAVTLTLPPLGILILGRRE